MKASEWIDQAKEAQGWESDYRAAKELGLSKNTISNYRHRTPTLDDETAAKIAAALDVEPHLIVLDQVAERTKSDAVRVSLAGLLARIGGGGGMGRPLDITKITASDMPGGDPARHSTEYSLCPAKKTPRAALCIRQIPDAFRELLSVAFVSPQPRLRA